MDPVGDARADDRADEDADRRRPGDVGVEAAAEQVDDRAGATR